MTVLDTRPPDGSDKSLLGLTSEAAGGVSAGAVLFGADFDKTVAADPDRPWSQSREMRKLSREQYLEIARTAESQAITFLDSSVRARWVRSQKAAMNQHPEGSKYTSDQWRGRSKLFRPKTRNAIRKHCRNLAKSLFGPGKVVSAEPQDEQNPMQVASAALKTELLNYRLSRESRRNGIPWFQIAVGARKNSLIYGVAISKQTWRYRVEYCWNDDGTPEIDEETQQQKFIVLEDRPDILLYPPENVLFSEVCDWTNPAQTTEVLILRHQMSVTEAMGMISSSNKYSAVKFDPDIDAETLRALIAPKQGPQDTQSTRTARHSGNDPLQQTNTTTPPLWLHEVFAKIDGRDMVFWTIGKHKVISEPVPVRKAYPAVNGERPVVIGYGEIEPHVSYPMAPVESWGPIQNEINDQVNLRLDHMKQVVTPLAMVRRGRQIDIKAVQSRGGNNGVVLVQNPAEDVVYAQIPDLPQSAYVENNYLNADFDDAAGTFNAGSVSTNRSLNETVGGMKMLSSDASDSGDYDTTVFTETYLEPTMWQVLKNIEYYEDDEKVLQLCGQKAKLIELFGINDITDELLMAECHLNLKLGMAASNLPQERLQKFAMGSEILGKITAPFIQAGKNKMPSLKMKEVVNSIYGDAGIPDAADRFFNDLDDEPAPPNQGADPEMQKMQAEFAMKQKASEQDLQFKKEEHQLDIQQKREEAAVDRQLREQEMQFKLQENEQNNQIRMQQANQNAQVQQTLAAQKLQTGAMMAGQKMQVGEAQAQQKMQQGEQQFAQKQQQAMAMQAQPQGQPGAPMPGGGGSDPMLAQAIQALVQSNMQIQELLKAVLGGGQQQQAQAQPPAQAPTGAM